MSEKSTIPNSDFIAIKNVMTNLLNNAKYCWDSKLTIGNYRLDNKAILTRETLRQFMEEVDGNALKRIMNKVTDRIALEADASIFLPPLDDDPLFVPLLTFELDSNEPKASFRVDFCQYDEPSNSLRYAGFRFETPTANSSKHRYYHVQPIEDAPDHLAQVVAKNREYLGTIPCIPIHADNPMSLILCMILSLYGREGYNKITADLPIDEAFSKHVGACLTCGNSFIETGWK
jgi:hypothetical protein